MQKATPRLTPRTGGMRPVASRSTYVPTESGLVRSGMQRLDATRPARGPDTAQTKLALVASRDGEPVTAHPELRGLLSDGWTVRSAVPRVVEGKGKQLLVVLVKPPIQGPRTAHRLRPRPKRRGRVL